MIQIPLKAGRHLPRFRWRADDGPRLNSGLVAVVFQGIRTNIAKKPYILKFFRGGGVRNPCPPSGPAHGRWQIRCNYET